MNNYNYSLYSNYQIVCYKNSQLQKELWDFKSDKNFTYMLEHVTGEQANNYLKEIESNFGELFLKNKELFINLCNKNDLYGKTQKKYITNFIVTSPSNLRYIYHSLLILKYIKESSLDNLNIIEIGGGYGGLAFFINKLAYIFDIKICSYTIFDLLEASNLQTKYLDALKIDNTKCYQINNFENLKKDSFLISNYAFSEISLELQKEYTEKILNPYTLYGFLVWNAIPVYDFVVNKNIYKEYEIPQTGNNIITNYYVKFEPKNN